MSVKIEGLYQGVKPAVYTQLPEGEQTVWLVPGDEVIKYNDGLPHVVTGYGDKKLASPIVVWGFEVRRTGTYIDGQEIPPEPPKHRYFLGMREVPKAKLRLIFE